MICMWICMYAYIYIYITCLHMYTWSQRPRLATSNRGIRREHDANYKRTGGWNLDRNDAEQSMLKRPNWKHHGLRVYATVYMRALMCIYVCMHLSVAALHCAALRCASKHMVVYRCRCVCLVCQHLLIPLLRVCAFIAYSMRYHWQVEKFNILYCTICQYTML